MEAQSFELNIGWSPAGGFVSSADADLHGTFLSLDEAKSAAEDHADRRLEWTFNAPSRPRLPRVINRQLKGEPETVRAPSPGWTPSRLAPDRM